MAQERYVHYHNVRSQGKLFEVGENCLILTLDSPASRVFSRWHGRAMMAEVKSLHSYVVDLEGRR
jgi:hypothetical protein